MDRCKNIATLILCLVGMAASLQVGESAWGQVLRYQPKVGQELEYGIEYRLICRDAKEPEIRKRARIRYRITNVTDDHWEADFDTNPFKQHGPYSNPEELSREPQKMSFTIPRTPLGPQMPFGSAGPGSLLNSSDAMNKYLQRMLEAQVANLKLYPGLFRFCRGKVRANFQGELLAFQTSTNIPMLVGQLTNVPLIRLSTKDAATPFGYKDIRKVNLISTGESSDVEPEQTSVSLLQSVKLSDSTQADIAAFDVEVELAGGLSVGAEIRVSGTGYSEFSLNDSMPRSGNMDYEVKGLTYGGQGQEYSVRVSFQRLEPWRRSLFDAMMLPTATALDIENMPRLTDQQLRNLANHFGKRIGPSKHKVDTALFFTAPPAIESAAFKAVDQTADRDSKQAVASVKSSGDRRDIETGIQAARSIRSRWIQIWRAARSVERDWGDASGAFSITARMIGKTETDVALSRVDNGQRVYVPLERLSEKDREIAETFGLSPDAIRMIQ